MAHPTASCSGVVRALALVVLAGVFLRAGQAPVAMLDSWSDWKVGQWIWEHRRLPDRELFSPYSDPTLHPRDGSWLAEVTYYLVLDRGGLEGVSLLHALLETAKAALFLWAVRRSTGSLGMAVFATVLMEAACWPYFDAIRTQTPAQVCWAGLFVVCSGRMSWRAVIAAPILVGLWANLSPTFGFAFVLLGAELVSGFLQGARGRRSLSLAASDPAVACRGLMLALALAAACCNPYGVAHLSDAFGRRGMTVVAARLWPHLIPVDSAESRALIASILVVLAVLRLSPRRLTPAEVVLTAAFAGWAWFDKRVAPWWLMLAPWLLAPHLQVIAQTALSRGRDGENKEIRRQGVLSALLISLSPYSPYSPYLLGGTAAVLVLLSPAARWAAGHPLPVEQRIGPMTPYHLAAQLAAREPPGRRILCLPYWWGDYLLWRLPQDQVFWYSRPEGFMRPPEANLPRMDSSADEWGKLIDQYGFDTLAVQADAVPGLFAYLDRLPPGQWTVAVDNTSADAPGGGPASRGVVVVRRTDP